MCLSASVRVSIRPSVRLCSCVHQSVCYATRYCHTVKRNSTVFLILDVPKHCFPLGDPSSTGDEIGRQLSRPDSSADSGASASGSASTSASSSASASAGNEENPRQMIPPGGTVPAAGTSGTGTSTTGGMVPPQPGTGTSTTGGMVPPQPGANGFPNNGFGFGGFNNNPWGGGGWGGGGWSGFGNPWGNNNPYYYNYGQNPNTNNFDSNTGKGVKYVRALAKWTMYRRKILLLCGICPTISFLSEKSRITNSTF